MSLPASCTVPVTCKVRSSTARCSEKRAIIDSLGRVVPQEKATRGFKGLVSGDYDHLLEAAFCTVGLIDEAIEKTARLAAEA